MAESWGEKLLTESLPALAGGGIFGLIGGLVVLLLPTVGYGCATGGISPTQDALCTTPLRDVGALGGVLPLLDAAVRVGIALAFFGAVLGLIAWALHDTRPARPVQARTP